nr:helix-turn-helix domain-containing protein [Ktedonospora formicarum]
MKQKHAYKYRCSPTDEQKQTLARTLAVFASSTIGHCTKRPMRSIMSTNASTIKTSLPCSLS